MNVGSRRFPNVVIRASAGTGKTFALSNRFIALVADGRPQDAILATTFTRKAAGEILARVLSRLADAALDDAKAVELAKYIGNAKLDRTRCLTLLKGMVRQLHRLRVGTLDQFFMQIARSFSLELDLPPAWQIVDETVDARLRATAVAELLSAQSTDDAVRLMHLLTKGEASRSISRQISDLVDGLYGLYLEAPPSAWHSLQRLKMSTETEIASRLVELEAAELPSDKRFIKARDEDIERFRSGQWEEFIAKGMAAKVADGSLNFYRKEIPEAVVEIYQHLLAHAKAVVINTIANQTQATFDLLERFDSVYQRLKHSRRAMRFEDVTRAISSGWIEEHIDKVLYRLDSHLLHMLLDEFQDTSLLQWQILRPFARWLVGQSREKSFFCVGDVKQAIYGWRGGVAEIFEAIDRELGNVEHESLDTSFRSSGPVIDTVNKVFDRMVSNPALKNYQAAAVAWDSRFRRQDTARGELPGYCRLVAAPRAEQDQPQSEATLSFAADEISRIRQKAPWADIGVLVRRNVTVGRMIHELRRRGLEASEEGGNPLNDSPAVVLILSLLRLTDHPGDTTARFHLAYSPLGRSLGFTRHDDASTAERLATEVRTQLMNNGYGPTIDGWTRILAEACDNRDLGRLAQLVELAYDYESEATSRPSDFVDLVEHRRVEDPTSARLRVMTVHQAKGLQFDIVVLPELDIKLRGQPGMVAVGRTKPTEPISHVCRHVSQKTRAILPASLVKMFDEQERREVEEALCLLYVSLTRAVHALHMIVAPSAANEKNLPATFAGVLRGGLCSEAKPAEPGTVLFEHGDRQWFASGAIAVATAAKVAENTETETPKVQTTLQFKFAPASKENRRGLERRSPSQLEGGSLVDLAERLRLDSDEALARGTLIHAWFEKIIWLDASEPDNTVLLDIARRQGFSQEDASDNLIQFRRWLTDPTVRNALSLAAYRGPTVGGQISAAHLAANPDAKSPHWQLWRERTFAVDDGDAILSGSIDRLVVLYDDRKPVGADVIDFKTDAISRDSSQILAERIEYYRPQLEAYRRAVGTLTGLSVERITTRLLFTQAGCLQEIS